MIFLALVALCFALHLTVLYFLKRDDADRLAQFFSSYVAGTALAGTLTLLLPFVRSALLDAPMPVALSIIPISIVVPHIGLSLFLWVFFPWRLKRSSKSMVAASVIASASIYLSIALGIWIGNQS